MGENETEKSAKLVIDHVANISVPVGTSTANALNNWSSVTRKTQYRRNIYAMSLNILNAPGTRFAGFFYTNKSMLH